MSYKCSDPILCGGSVCSLRDPWPSAEAGVNLSKSFQGRDLRVFRRVLVKAAEITFICSTVCLVSVSIQALKGLKKQQLWKRNYRKNKRNKGDTLRWEKILINFHKFSFVGSFPLHLASWDLFRMGAGEWGVDCMLTTNYTWETGANKPRSKLLTPRKCCSLPHNKQFPKQNKI